MLSNYSLVIGSTAALTEIDQEPLMQESFIRHLQLLAIACQWNFVTCVFANLIDPMSTQ
jgi:hypothetical protein